MKFVSIAALMALLMASPATAQYDTQVYIGSWDLGTSLSSDLINQQMITENLNEQLQYSELSNSRTADYNSAQKLAPITILKFAPSASRKSRNLAQFVEKSREADPQGAAQMERLFASTDVIGEIGKGIAPYGLKTNNVADAYAVYWMTAWQVAHGDTSDFTRSQSQAVKQQAANALLATPEFVSATDAVKQEMAEAYLVQAALIQASVDVAQTDRTIAKGLPSAVRKGAKASGLDLDAMTLTDEGFVPAQ